MFRSLKRANLFSGIATLALLPLAPAYAADVSSADARNEDAASEIVVKGQKPVTSASSGTKTDTPILETPQSISVIDASRIADLGLQNLNQTLRYVAGVTPDTRGASAEVYDQFKLRGFDAPAYLDGLKMFDSATGYANPQVDISRLDRIEVIKGPASVLYGQSTPGGLVAESSKLPLNQDFYGAVAGTYGTDNLYRVNADVGGRLKDDILFRLYGSVNGADSQQTYGKRRRENVSAAVTLGANTPTSLTVLAAYSHDPRNGNYGVFPALGTLVDNPAGRISSKFYGGEPGDFFKREQFGLTYIFRHEFGGGWTFRSSGRYQLVKSHLGIVYTAGSAVDTSDPAPTFFQRSSYATSEQTNNWTYDNQLSGKFETGQLKHSILIGADRQISHTAELAAFSNAGTIPAINAFNPIYGTMATPQTPADVLNPSPYGGNFRTHLRQQGIYAQDQVSVGGLRVTLSGRQDWTRQLTIGGTEQSDEKFTYRAGVLYVTPLGLAPYISYSTSFEPKIARLSNNQQARPSSGKQVEAGLKYQLPNTDILVTGSWFRIEQTNLVVTYPDNTSNQIGKVRSQGIEIEASGSLPYGFKANVAFSHQHIKKIADSDLTVIGLPLATAGRGGISANLEWSPKGGPAEGLTIGGAVRHVNGVYADYFTYSDGSRAPLYTPAFTVFDALARLDMGKVSPSLEGMTVGINATNLFNKRYLTSCFANYGWCWFGQRRTLQATVGFHW